MTAFGGLAGQPPVLDAPDITVSVRQTFGYYVIANYGKTVVF